MHNLAWNYHQLFGEVGQCFVPTLGDQHIVFDPHTEIPDLVKARLIGINGARRQWHVNTES